MHSQCTNIYKLARSNTSLTQREASEKMFISLRSIADYETNKTIPPDDVVCMMVEAYNTSWLAYEHLRKSTMVGKKYLPKIKYSELAQSVLMFQKEVNDLDLINTDMINIACDNIIHSHQENRWREVSKEIEDIAGAALSLIFTQKKTSLEGNLEKVGL